MTSPSVNDIVWTAVAYWCIWHKAIAGGAGDLDEIASDPRLDQYLTVAETVFLQPDDELAHKKSCQTPVSQFAEPFAVEKRCETIWTLLWSVGVAAELRPAGALRNTAETLGLFIGRSPEDIVYEARRRRAAEIEAALDFSKRALGAAKDGRHIIQARVDALDWVMGF